MAFFPCVRFEDQILLSFRGEASPQKKWSNEKKLEHNLKLHKELSKLYSLITKLAIVCIRKKIPLIIENPYSSQHYLVRYWCLKSKVIDKDRYSNGDYFKKPTQYWFINCEPKYNLVFEALEQVDKKIICGPKEKGGVSNTVERSLIHPQYARRFIKEYVLESEAYKVE